MAEESKKYIVDQDDMQQKKDQRARPTNRNIKIMLAIFNSPLLVKRTIGSGKTMVVKVDNDLIYNELKPVKFDGLYKKDMSSLEMIEQVTKLAEHYKEDNLVGEKQRINRGIRSIKADEDDNLFPFKQDKLSCNIF